MRAGRGRHLDWAQYTVPGVAWGGVHDASTQQVRELHQLLWLTLAAQSDLLCQQAPFAVVAVLGAAPVGDCELTTKTVAKSLHTHSSGAACGRPYMPEGLDLAAVGGEPNWPCTLGRSKMASVC